jgi:hypothetical protein
MAIDSSNYKPKAFKVIEWPPQYPLEAALSELRGLRSSMGHVSGKEVRRLICRIRRARKPVLCRLPSERVLIELVTQFMHVKNPNKIARLIRRAVTRKAGR